MKKSITLLFLFFSLAMIVSAQSKTQDVVYLNNGSIIRGEIIEQIPNQLLKIETADGSVFVYKMNQVKKITKEQITSSNNTNSGYLGIVDFGYDIGVGNLGIDRLKFDIINGYKFNPYISIGLGTGVHYYSDYQAALVPIFANFRAHFLDADVSPFINAEVGYAFDATNNFNSTGFILNPSVGASFYVSNAAAINISVGYELQKMDFLYYNYGYLYFAKGNSGSLNLNIGVSF